MPIASFWLYRIGITFVDANAKRFLAGETWVSLTPPISDLNTRVALGPHARALRRPFGPGAVPHYDNAAEFESEIFPKPRLLNTLFVSPSSIGPQLNVNAPESSFRLQRVGLAASGSRGVGRITLPILADTWYTDVPQRRHVDVATLAPLITTHLETFAKTFTTSGRTYTNVIFNRATLSWTNLSHYTLLENPVRIWQRWRTYDYVHRGTSSSHYQPPEL